jgi:hypothetical protein
MPWARGAGHRHGHVVGVEEPHHRQPVFEVALLDTVDARFIQEAGGASSDDFTSPFRRRCAARFDCRCASSSVLAGVIGRCGSKSSRSTPVTGSRWIMG